MIYKEVVREPVIREADVALQAPALVADLGVRGVWQPRSAVLPDNRVIDTDAQSYAHRDVGEVLAAAEREKLTRKKMADFKEGHV